VTKDKKNINNENMSGLGTLYFVETCSETKREKTLPSLRYFQILAKVPLISEVPANDNNL